MTKDNIRLLMFGMEQEGFTFTLTRDSVKLKGPRDKWTEERKLVLGTLHNEVREVLIQERKRPH